jgi:hypothetical protein
MKFAKAWTTKMEQKTENKYKDLLKLDKAEQMKRICDELVRTVLKKELHVGDCPNELLIKVMELYGIQSYAIMGARLSLDEDGDIKSARIELFTGDPTTLIGLVSVAQGSMLKKDQEQKERQQAVGTGLEVLRKMFEGK